LRRRLIGDECGEIAADMAQRDFGIIEIQRPGLAIATEILADAPLTAVQIRRKANLFDAFRRRGPFRMEASLQSLM
jgi:hypothetical protein